MTVLTAELTHFNLVIHLSKSQQLAFPFCAFLWSPAFPAVLMYPVNCISLEWSRAKLQKLLFISAAQARDKQHAPCMTRQQACPFPAGVVSLVSGEVKHIVHLIRWNLTAVLCQLGQDLTACLEWLNARLLGLGTESCLLFGLFSPTSSPLVPYLMLSSLPR